MVQWSANHGDTRPLHSHKPYVGQTWEHIEFDPVVVKRVWPEPPPQSAKDKMLAAAQHYLAERGQPPKRADLVKDCMEREKITKRAAEAAFNELPDTLRRGRGKPRKT